MKRLFALFAGLLALISLTASATVLVSPVRFVDGVITDKAGMTLYVYDKDLDHLGKSFCNGACSVKWPPMRADKNGRVPMDYSQIRRADGTWQWAYKNRPLYYYSKDLKQGDKTGIGVSKLWHVATPAK